MENQKWYFKTSVLVIALLAVGPLALPLLWFNPRYRLRTKVIVTVVTLALTYVLALTMKNSLQILAQYYRLAFSPS